MQIRRFSWFLLKKLPMILAVLVAPATLMLVLNYNPDLLRFFKTSTGPEPPVVEEPETERDATSAPPIVEPDFGFKRKEPPVEKGAEKPVEAEVSNPLSKEVVPEETVPKESTVLDWEKMAGEAKTAETFVALAKQARASERLDLERRFYLEALHLDPDHPEAHEGVGDVRFDPSFHLTEFDRYEGHQLEGALRPFRERTGEWLTGIRLAELREEWRSAKKNLSAELDRREADPLDARRRRHLRLLMRREFFSKIIGRGNFWTDRDHAPFMFFLEGDEMEDRGDLKPFIDTVAADLARLHTLFQNEYASSSGSGNDQEPLFFVWVLRTKGGFKSAYDGTDKMLVLHRPPGESVYRDNEPLRRQTARVFGRMMMQYHGAQAADSEPAVWILEGLPVLMAMGKGVHDDGSLRLNGEGMAYDPDFARWIAWNKSAWPIPLESLVEFEDLDVLFRACSSKRAGWVSTLVEVEPDVLLSGAITACALFCRFLNEDVDPEAFKDYAAAKIAGRETLDDLESLRGDRSFAELERAIIERYANEADLGEGGKKRSSERTGPSSLEEEGDGTITSKDILALIRPGIPAQDFRSVIIHLVRKVWCQAAWAMLESRMLDTNLSPAAIGVDKDLEILEQAAAFEDDLFSKLVEKGASFTFNGTTVTLEESREGLMVLAPDRGKDKIRTACSNMGFARFIATCKREIEDGKSENHRFGYCRFYLLHDDGAMLRKELRLLKSNPAAEELLKDRLELYDAAADGSRLLDYLSDGEGEDLNRLKKLHAPLRDSYLSIALEPLIKRFIREQVFLKYTHSPEEFLASEFVGFQALEPGTGAAIFVYDFETPEEVNDFDLEEHPLFSELLGNEGALPGWKRFSIRDGNLACYGSNGAVLIPVFTGDLQMSVTFRMAEAEDDTVSMDAYFGYGLGSEKGVIASAYITDLWIETSSTGRPWFEKGSDRLLELDRPHTISLRGTEERIIQKFDDSDKIVLAEKGHRTGQVFFFVSMPLNFMLEHVEVRAVIDPVWLKKAAADLVEEEVKRILY